MNYFVLFSSPFCLINRVSIEPRQYLSLVRHKPGCTTTEDSQRLELSDLESKRVAKTCALISYALTAQLMCSFDFTYAKSRFSYDATKMKTLFVLNDKIDKTRASLITCHRICPNSRGQLNRVMKKLPFAHAMKEAQMINRMCVD